MRIKQSAEDELAAFLDQLGQVDNLTRPLVVRTELAAILEHGLPHRATGVLAADLPSHTRRRRMLTALSSALATLTGKVVLGTAVAAASVGVAHSAGVVDVPGLPDTTPAVESPGDNGMDGSGSNTGGEAPDRSDAADGNGAPDGSGVDGDEISDRATSGEPQDDGLDFGTSVAEDATDGTPADGQVGGSGLADVPADAETGTENRSDTAPSGSDTAGEHTPDDAPATDAPTGRP